MEYERNGAKLDREPKEEPDTRAHEASRVSADDLTVLNAIRRGDERAFEQLAEKYGPSLLRFAMIYAHNRGVAEELVQDAWIGFLESIDRFEGRASLKTWLFRILINSAKKRMAKEQRTVPFSAFESETAGETGLDSDRFLPASDRFAWHWKTPPSSWEDVPAQRLLSKETLAHVEAAIASLSSIQREVITLRDVEGWSAAEVCNVLGLTETNQRVLLHRARTKVRNTLERYLDDER